MPPLYFVYLIFVNSVLRVIIEQRERQLKLSEQTDKLLQDALNTEAKYCITCRHSYISDLLGCGYCRFTTRKYGGINVPKNITEFSTCKHWKPKPSKKDNTHE